MDELVQSASEKMTDLLENLYGVWDRIGINNEVKDSRKQTILNVVEDTFNRMLKEEQALENRLVSNVEKYKKKVSELSSELSKETKEFDNLSLLQTERKLKDYHLTLQKEKERRLEELLPLLEEEATLAVRLGMQCSNLDPEVVPSQNDMKELVVSITMLKEEAGKRENAFQVYELE